MYNNDETIYTRHRGSEVKKNLTSHKRHLGYIQGKLRGSEGWTNVVGYDPFWIRDSNGQQVKNQYYRKLEHNGTSFRKHRFVSKGKRYGEKNKQEYERKLRNYMKKVSQTFGEKVATDYEKLIRDLKGTSSYIQQYSAIHGMVFINGKIAGNINLKTGDFYPYNPKQ